MRSNWPQHCPSFQRRSIMIVTPTWTKSATRWSFGRPRWRRSSTRPRPMWCPSMLTKLQSDLRSRAAGGFDPGQNQRSAGGSGYPTSGFLRQNRQQAHDLQREIGLCNFRQILRAPRQRVTRYHRVTPAPSWKRVRMRRCSKIAVSAR